MLTRATSSLVLLLVLIGLTLPTAQADITLRYKMAANETLTYNCTLNGSGMVRSPNLNAPLDTEAVFVYRMVCTGVDPEGKLTVEHRVENLTIHARLGNQPLPVTAAIPAVTTVIEPTGKLVSFQVQRPAAEGGMGAEALGGLAGLAGSASLDLSQFLGEMRSPGFPVEPVHPGSRWQDIIQMTSQAGEPMNLTYTTRFLDYALLTGRNCARLQTDYELPLELTLSAGFSFALTGKHRGSQIAYFDYEAGRVLRYDGTSDTEMMMAPPSLFSVGEAGQPSATLTLRSTISVVLESTEEI